MKSAQQHTTSFSRCLLILSGIVLFSIFPFEIESDGNKFGDLNQFGTEYLAENKDNAPAEKDANDSTQIFELAFKQTAEIIDSAAGTNGFAVFKQGIHNIEVSSNDFISECSLLYKSLKLLSKEYSPDVFNRTSVHFFFYLLSHSGDIAINAP